MSHFSRALGDGGRLDAWGPEPQLDDNVVLLLVNVADPTDPREAQVLLPPDVARDLGAWMAGL
jgi:hypothetical protein